MSDTEKSSELHGNIPADAFGTKHQSNPPVSYIFDPNDQNSNQHPFPIFQKAKKRTEIVTIPRANLNIPASQSAGNSIHVTSKNFGAPLGFLNATGVLDDPESGHRHPTYLHSSGVHGHHQNHSHSRRPTNETNSIMDQVFQSISISSPKKSETVAPGEVTNEKSAKTRHRPRTAPHGSRSVQFTGYRQETVKPKTSFEHHVNLRPKSAAISSMRYNQHRQKPPLNVELAPLIFENHTKPENETEILQSVETYHLNRAAKQPSAPVAPTIVKTQTVRSNLDGFAIEKVALRRLRFVVENNESEVEHLQIVDLVESGQVPASVIATFFGPEYQTPHDLRVLLLQSIDKSRRIRIRLRKNLASQAPTNLSPQPLEHPIHDTAPPNQGLKATYHHTHPHHVSPATPIASYTAYTVTTFTQPDLSSVTLAPVAAQETLYREPRESSGAVNVVPRGLEARHQVQAHIMLTKTTSDAAANVVVERMMEEAAAEVAEEAANSGEVLGAGLVLGQRPASGKNRRPSSAKSSVKSGKVSLKSGGESLRAGAGGRVTPVPATCMPERRALTPTAMTIARDAASLAVKKVDTDVRRVTTPSEVLDILRQVEGEKSVLRGVIADGWRNSDIQSRERQYGVKLGTLEQIVIQNMDLSNPGGRRPSRSSLKSYTTTELQSVTTEAIQKVEKVQTQSRPKKHVRILAEEPAGGEPEFDTTSTYGVKQVHSKIDINAALNERHMLRIIERRRARYLDAGIVS